MDLLKTLLRRRSIRKYTEDAIPEEKLNKILQAGMLAPTSRNRRPCEFYVVQNREILRKLSAAKATGAGMLADCDTAIAVFGDTEKADTWIEDCSIALTCMHLMAAAEGVGSCWCQMHLRASAEGKDAEETVKELLYVPESYRIVGILSMGMPAQKPEPHTLDELEWEKVHWRREDRPQE